MAKSEKGTVTIQELLVSSFRSNRRLGQAANRKRRDYTARVDGKDQGRTGDISADAETNGALTTGGGELSLFAFRFAFALSRLRFAD
jgi:hypothetical protein